MDAKDFRLLALLNEDARRSFQAFGRRLSLSAPAVRERLRRLEKRGIVQGYWVSIDPAVFGRGDLLVAFDPEWSREEALRALEAPEVAWTAWKVDGGLTVQLWPRDADRAIANLSRFLGRLPNWHGIARSGWSGQLSGLDWRILEILVSEPLAPVERISSRTNLSPKTVRKHLDALVKSEAIYVVARIGLPTDAGVLVYHLVVGGNAALPDLRRAIGDAELIHETEDPSMKYLFCRADSLAELTATMRAVEKLPGVSSVRLSLNREMLLGTEFVLRLVRERVARRETP